MRSRFGGRLAGLAVLLFAVGYLSLCWHISSLFGGLTIAMGGSYRSVTDKIGQPTSVDKDILVGARWNNFNGTGWMLRIQTKGYDFNPDDPIIEAALFSVLDFDDAYFIACSVPEPRTNRIAAFLEGPTGCWFGLRA